MGLLAALLPLGVSRAGVHGFLKRKFLYWLEAVSLLCGMSQAVLAIQKLETVVVSLNPISLPP